MIQNRRKPTLTSWASSKTYSKILNREKTFSRYLLLVCYCSRHLIFQSNKVELLTQLAESFYCSWFFQDVFPEDFGPTYDKAIQTLMWLFLSRLEKLIPSQTLQQVSHSPQRAQCFWGSESLSIFFFFCQIASLLTNSSSVLSECMETLTQPQELKTLLDSYKDLSQLEDLGESLTDPWTVFFLPAVTKSHNISRLCSLASFNKLWMSLDLSSILTTSFIVVEKNWLLSWLQTLPTKSFRAL